MPSAEERFRAKITRQNGHDIWTGFIDDRGTGMVRINGRLMTVQRAAWEFAYGAPPPGARVNSCAVERACVRLAHLSLTTPNDRKTTPTGRRRPRGSGSKREIRPNVWQLAITEAIAADGQPIRRFETFHGDETAADAALDTLAGHVRHQLGDLRVRELIGRYLYINHDRGSVAFQRDLALLHDVIEPQLGDHLAETLTHAELLAGLHAVYRDSGPSPTSTMLGLTHDSYRWARQQDWTHRDPTAQLTLRTVRTAAMSQ